MIGVYRAPRWCPDCGHETHEPKQCLYRMSQHEIVQQMARGRGLPANLRCRCETGPTPCYCGAAAASPVHSGPQATHAFQVRR